MNAKYNHKEVELNKNNKWIEKQYFINHNRHKKPFTIILPPPNVTGKLHLGHAWNSYLQDAVIRYKKLAGYDVMWIPGIDHAGIATQSKVEEWLLKKENITKYDLKRNKFIKKIWIWKQEYENKIKKQWSKLGLALDYNNERFTMDKGSSQAVSKVFINLYNQKLIFKGTRSINFDINLKTVLSNIEVENRPIQQKFFYIKYKLENKGDVVVATTRPETLFSDMALAVNPQNKKYQHLIGKNAINPLNHKKLPIIADKSIANNKGSGVMKVSAHSHLDVEILMKHKMKIIECIDDNGILNDQAMEFANLDRFKARDKIIAKLDQENKIVKIVKKISNVAFSQRTNTIIEILVKPQWFVKMNVMSEIVVNDLKHKKIKFFPRRFIDHLQQWMENANDWCISRQIWWGHRIPVWYKDGKTKVQVESPGTDWKQDEDVLDTWFSSGLIPFSFLGWPKNTTKLTHYYPIDLLVTGYDIIFFWVARMYFQSLQIMKKCPFKNVLIHGLIRAEDGKKMSKSLGNGIDPMMIIYKYGSDALRWFLLTSVKPGQDIRFSKEKIKFAWSINNKLWNISRYILIKMINNTDEITAPDKWINNQLFNLKTYIDKRIDHYDFTIIGKKIYKFIYEDLSSWYLEMSKINPNQKFAKNILKKTLIIIHPFLPFITDHIYSFFDQELLESALPDLKKIITKNNITMVIKIIKLIRQFRSIKKIPNNEIIRYWTSYKLKQYNIKVINKLANAIIEKNNDALITYQKCKIFIKLSKEQKNKENLRILTEITRLKNEIKRSQTILSNQGFIKNAPLKKITAEKKKLINYQQELNNLSNKQIFSENLIDNLENNKS